MADLWDIFSTSINASRGTEVHQLPQGPAAARTVDGFPSQKLIMTNLWHSSENSLVKLTS